MDTPSASTRPDVAAFDALFAPSPAEDSPAAVTAFGVSERVAAELATIEALFDLLIRYSPDPAPIRALRALTAHFLRGAPAEEQTAVVLQLLQRQVEIVRHQLESRAGQEPAPPPVSAGAAAVESPAPTAPVREAIADAPPTQPAMPPRRGADGGVTGLSARRRMVGWLRKRAGGSAGELAKIKAPSRSQLKSALMASVWLGVGGLTIAYAGTLIYINVMRLEIDTAMISGAVEAVNAPSDGVVTTILANGGDMLREGARILTLEDPEVEKLVKLAGVKVERAREDMRLKQAEYESERSKRDEYLNISRNKSEKIDAEVAALTSQSRIARDRFDRLADLYKKGLTIRPRVEEASDRLADLTAQLQRALINQKERAQLHDGVIAGNYFDGNSFVGKYREAEAALARASAEVDLALEELQVLQQRRTINRVAAAHDLRILKVLKPEGSAVRRGDSVLLAERLNERQIQAFVRQEQANLLAIGDEAMVFVPALRAKVKARIVSVERNAAFLDDVDARYSWKMARDPGVKPTDKDRSARVVLKFDGLDDATAQKTFDIGMPTVVSFQRRSMNTVLSGFTELGAKL